MNVLGRENSVTLRKVHVFQDGFILSLCKKKKKNSFCIRHWFLFPCLSSPLHYCETVDRNFAFFLILSMLSIMSLPLRVRQKAAILPVNPNYFNRGF